MGFSSGKIAPNNVDLTSSQTVSNKTLDGTTVIQNGATITTPDIISPSRLDVKKDTLANLQTYASTASNGQMCFATDTKQMFQVIDSALAEVSGGSGGINYIENGDYNQDDSGTTGDTNLVISRETVAPLRGDGSLKIAKGAINASTQSVTIPFTIDTADLAKKLTITFDKDFSDPNYADGDAQVRIIKDPAGTPVTIRVNGEDIAGGKESHIAQFQTDATELDYALEIYWNDTGALAVNAYMDNIQVGPREVSLTALTSEWRTFTPNIVNVGSGGWATLEGTYRREGDSARIRIYAIKDGTAGTGTSSVFFQHSSIGLADFDKLTSPNANTNHVGNSAFIPSGNAEASAPVVLGTNDEVGVSDVGINQFLRGDDFPAGAQIKLEYLIPIIGWETNFKMSEDLGQREVVARYETSVSTSLSGTAVDIKYTSKISDTTNSYNTSTGIYTVPETGYYDISAGNHCGAVATANNQYLYTHITVDDDAKTTNYQPVFNGSSFVVAQSELLSYFLTKGQEVKVQCASDIAASRTTGTQARYQYFSIKKTASPQTILETETVAASYVSEDGQVLSTAFDVLKFEIKHEDTHNAYNTSTGIYTIPVSGYYVVSYGFAKSGATSRSRVDGKMQHLYANGDPLTDFGFGAGLLASAAAQDLSANGSVVRKFTKGDTIKVRGDVDTANANLSQTEGKNYFSIAKIK